LVRSEYQLFLQIIYEIVAFVLLDVKQADSVEYVRGYSTARRRSLE